MTIAVTKRIKEFLFFPLILDTIHRNNEMRREKMPGKFTGIRKQTKEKRKPKGGILKSVPRIKSSTKS